MDTLAIEDLLPGDVLLCRSNHWLGQLILWLDQGDYSHAALYVGNGQVVQAVARGVIQESVRQSPLLLVQERIDVFRYHATVDSTDRDLTSDEARRVLERASAFVAAEHAYAYDELLLVGILCLTRDLSADHLSEVEQKMLRVALDHATDWIFRCIEDGKEPMICSEAVYRCFAEADPPGSLALTITGVLFERLQAGRTASATLDPGLATARDELSSAWRKLTAARPQPDGAAWDPVVASCVTPHDLQTSPSLRRIGTLESLRSRQ